MPFTSVYCRIKVVVLHFCLFPTFLNKKKKLQSLQINYSHNHSCNPSILSSCYLFLVLCFSRFEGLFAILKQIMSEIASLCISWRIRLNGISIKIWTKTSIGCSWYSRTKFGNQFENLSFVQKPCALLWVYGRNWSQYDTEEWALFACWHCTWWSKSWPRSTSRQT